MRNRLHKFVFSWNTVFFLSKFNVMGITLGRKSLRNGRLSLYLDYCFNGKRQRQYLGIILDSPTDKHTRATNRAKPERTVSVPDDRNAIQTATNRRQRYRLLQLRRRIPDTVSPEGYPAGARSIYPVTEIPHRSPVTG